MHFVFLSRRRHIVKNGNIFCLSKKSKQNELVYNMILYCYSRSSALFSFRSSIGGSRRGKR